MNECPKCKFLLVDNSEPLDVLKMLRARKKEGDDARYPLLVADFYCGNCKKALHVKWVDLDKDINVMKCTDCNNELCATVFLGVMNGFVLESYCVNCHNKLNSGNITY